MPVGAVCHPHPSPQPVGMIVRMAATVTVQDEHGSEFRCTRLQWDRIHKPAGRKLVANEDGSKPRTTTRKADKADEGD